MIKIKPATTKSDFECISKLAHEIWHEHYPAIISLEQIAYMLEKFNSVTAIDNQTKTGSQFFYMTYNDVPVGYAAIKKESDFLFLEKLYILEGYRGKKMATAAIQFMEAFANYLSISKIKLNVNKYNVNSILAYKKMGFVETKSMVTDIGNGFVMDDYEMEKVF
ncbi:GNAT family N-acetyltransferase [Confluentibacter flavum]|uniref:GNAT family N-acetyltransferase n=1 Tax=Confluentibacter flavum TaxID=1909700 RepID=A0A2N3HNJ8_9FLAO|nr:GNAT family N-acetyltransferase [Confluentibacter flavum]PKQ46525.1 GNAT family N-acetyltransferase [Confluentibacter flavum]